MSRFFDEVIKPKLMTGRTIFRGSAFLRERKDVTETGQEELLSVSEYSGVTPRRNYLAENENLTRAESLEGYRVVKAGDLVMNYMLAWKGAQGVSAYEGITSPAYSVFEIDTGFANKRFVHYLFRSNLFKAYFRSESSGIIESRLRFYPESLKALKIPLPNLAEQNKLVAYLDAECARIDSLIDKKNCFIELLREKRQAIITQAVTKGLNPNVPMKDSGIEWLGDVPMHWNVRPIKAIVKTPITDGPHETPTFLDEGVPFVSAEAVSGGYLNFEKIRGYISREDHERYSQKYKPQRNDIYMIKSGATTGVTAIVDTDEEFNIWSPLAVIRCAEILEPNFVLNFMRSRSFQEAVALNWSFGTQQNIGMGVIGNLQIVVPPLVEQQDIVKKLNAMNSRISDLVSKTEDSIGLLKERRAALITAAVTGQIDLREAA